MFTLVHLSDIHLGPIEKPALRELLNKRMLGYHSWFRHRKSVHMRHIVDAMRDEILALAPDHVAITGDLVNIALESEFVQVSEWLSRFGVPGWISVVPGNHDAYIPLAWEKGMGRWAAYMAHESESGTDHPGEGEHFPYVRRRGDIALIGLSTAVPTLPFLARGWLGREQLDRLDAILASLSGSGLFRVIMVHHPPLPDQNRWRKAMADTAQFQDIVSRHGAELVLHGHNHHQMKAAIDDAIPVHGVASASARKTTRRPPAHFAVYRIDRSDTGWHCTMTEHAWDESEEGFLEVARNDLAATLNQSQGGSAP